MPPKRVLIVEDDRPLAEVLEYNFQQNGFSITLAADGQEAVRQSQLAAPDVIILDLMLPE